MDVFLDDLPVRPDGLIFTADAAAMGCGHRLPRLLRAGRVSKVWPGVYRLRNGPEPTGPAAEADRYLRRVRAAAHQMPDRVFTSYSAAAVLGLPIVGRWPQDVYALAGGRNGSRRAGVRYIGHRLEIPETQVGAIRLTSPAHTILQLARHAPLAAALVAADAALRDLPYSDEEPIVTLEELCAEHQRLRPYRGSIRVAAVLARATALADHPLESISRLVIEELGFAPPELQHRLWIPGLRRHVWVDFYWPELEIAMEADGEGKYLDAGSAAGAARRVVREKHREDEIRKQVNAFGRWSWEQAWKRQPLERILTRAGVPRVGPRRCLLAP